MADITWLGHAMFRLRGKDATIITDPFDRTLGGGFGALKGLIGATLFFLLANLATDMV